MTKNIYLSVELKNKDVDPDKLARLIAEDLVDVKTVKSVQYRYGAFGKVDKVFSRER